MHALEQEVKAAFSLSDAQMEFLGRAMHTREPPVINPYDLSVRGEQRIEAHEAWARYLLRSYATDRGADRNAYHTDLTLHLRQAKREDILEDVPGCMRAARRLVRAQR